jgi:hypothetical protein
VEGVTAYDVGLTVLHPAGTNHTTIVERVDWLVSIVTGFLDAGTPV